MKALKAWTKRGWAGRPWIGRPWIRRPWPPLALALLTAVAVHLLALTYGQLAARRQPAGGERTTAAPSRDDTPELLEFSRQQPLEETLATVPLPPPSSLPPPPDLRPAATPQQTGPNQARATLNMSQRPRSKPSKGQARNGPRPEKPRPQHQARRPGPVLERRGPAARPSTPAGPAQPGRPALAGTTDPQATLALWLEQARRGETAELLKPEADAAAVYARLWERARPALALPGAGGPPPQELELRRLPLAEARRQARATIAPQRQGVLLGDRLLLLWPEGSSLWLLRAPLASDAASAS